MVMSEESGKTRPLTTPQVTMKKGLKMFGTDGLNTVKKELQLLHDNKVMKNAKERTLPQNRGGWC